MLCSVAAVYIESVTKIQVHEGPYIVFGLAVVWAFVIAGLIARRRRPSNRTGLLMIGIGFAWLTAAFTDSPNDVVFTLGLIAEQLLAGAAGPPAAVVPDAAISIASPAGL